MASGRHDGPGLRRRGSLGVRGLGHRGHAARAAQLRLPHPGGTTLRQRRSPLHYRRATARLGRSLRGGSRASCVYRRAAAGAPRPRGDVLMWRKGILLALGLAVLLPAKLPARPRPVLRGSPSGFRLFARAVGALTINRVYCGLRSSGEICADSTGSGFLGGGFWPKGTANQYVFASGLQVAGVVGGHEGDPWFGDTTAAFFYEAGGKNLNGTPVGLM